METNKYYTPTIEEFHVGFEYQFNDFGTDGNLLSDWQKATIKCGTQIDDINRKEDNKNVYSLRVKLLDREDIISLDWELDSIVEKECFYIHKTSSLQNDIRLVFREKESSIEINSSKFGECFYGIIKNKSELKKLMNQLNIK